MSVPPFIFIYFDCICFDRNNFVDIFELLSICSLLSKATVAELTPWLQHHLLSGSILFACHIDVLYNKKAGASRAMPKQKCSGMLYALSPLWRYRFLPS